MVIHQFSVVNYLWFTWSSCHAIANPVAAEDLTEAFLTRANYSSLYLCPLICHFRFMTRVIVSSIIGDLSRDLAGLSILGVKQNE